MAALSSAKADAFHDPTARPGREPGAGGQVLDLDCLGAGYGTFALRARMAEYRHGADGRNALAGRVRLDTDYLRFARCNPQRSGSQAVPESIRGARIPAAAHYAEVHDHLNV